MTKTITLENVPNDVSHLAPVKNEVFPPSTIQLHYEPKLFHTSATNFKTQDFYQDYDMSTNITSVTRQTLMSNQAKRVADLCGKNTQRFVEVGCGWGDFLDFFKPYFKEVMGIEPSAVTSKAARSRGYTVINEYVTLEKNVTDLKFNAFAAKQVFEHLPTPQETLTAISRFLAPEAVGMIEVPNGYRAASEGRFYEFFPDHVQYYSANSLANLATACNFNIIEIRETLNRDYLELWIRWKEDESPLDAILNNRTKIGNSIHQFMNSQQGQSVAIWGAGAKTLCVFAYMHESLGKVTMVVDDDTYKNNKFIPNTEIPIVSSNSISKPVDTVLILALSYIKEIRSNVKRLLPNCKKIYTLNNQHEIIDITDDDSQFSIL